MQETPTPVPLETDSDSSNTNVQKRREQRLARQKAEDMNAEGWESSYKVDKPLRSIEFNEQTSVISDLKRKITGMFTTFFK